jgi:hypothetical protein
MDGKQPNPDINVPLEQTLGSCSNMVSLEGRINAFSNVL